MKKLLLMLGMYAAIPAVHGAELPYANVTLARAGGEMTVADGNDGGTKFILTHSGHNYTQGVAYTQPRATLPPTSGSSPQYSILKPASPTR